MFLRNDFLWGWRLSDMSTTTKKTPIIEHATRVISKRGSYLFDLLKRHCFTDVFNRLRNRSTQTIYYLERAAALFALLEPAIRKDLKTTEEKVLIINIEQNIPPYAGLLFAHLLHPRVKVLSIDIGNKNSARRLIKMKNVYNFIHMHAGLPNQLRNMIFNRELPSWNENIPIYVISLKGHGLIYKMFRRLQSTCPKTIGMFISEKYCEQFLSNQIKKRVPDRIIMDQNLPEHENLVLLDTMHWLPKKNKDDLVEITPEPSIEKPIPTPATVTKPNTSID